MQIVLKNISKRYNRQWIFRNANLELSLGNSYVLSGLNGSGKSTLLSIISGFQTPTDGEIFYSREGKKIDGDDFYKYISIAAPYLELIEELTLSELIDFNFEFTEFLSGENKITLLDFIKLSHAKDKQVSQFSSGMKQRVKLGLALWANKPILLLDEPTVNLDHEGIAWYQQMMPYRIKDKLTVICSNLPHEYMFCENIYYMRDFWKQ